MVTFLCYIKHHGDKKHILTFPFIATLFDWLSNGGKNEKGISHDWIEVLQTRNKIKFKSRDKQRNVENADEENCLKNRFSISLFFLIWNLFYFLMRNAIRSHVTPDLIFEIIWRNFNKKIFWKKDILIKRYFDKKIFR